jgi:hypothetical protein
MRLRNRLILVGVGVVIFLIATPLLILYARGFEYDFATHKIVKTGAIVVDTQPNKASVFVDDKLQKDTTPLSIRFVLPKDYNIRVEKSGYQNWTKRLSVKSQFVTWVNQNRDTITLFLTEPNLNRTISADQTLASQYRDEIAFSNAGQISTLSVNKGNISNLGSFTSNPVVLPAFPILWENSNSTFDSLKNHPIVLTKAQLSTIENVETDGNHFIGKIGTDLYSLSPTVSLIDKNVLTYTLDGNSVWYIQGNFLKRYDFINNNFETIQTDVPLAESGQIIRADNYLFAVLDGTLYRINDKLEKIYGNVSTTDYDSSSAELMFANNNEIFIYHLSDQSTELILRSSTQIQNPILNFSSGYVFYQNEGKIKAIELDGRDHRNLYTIADAMSNFAVSNDAKFLYTYNNTTVKEYTIR